jgi:Na+/proline symporter
MTTGFGFWDYAVFIAYALLILGVGLWVSRDKKGEQKIAEDYFLAGKSLSWWAIGASLFAAAYSIYGGLSAVAWTDVIQVVFLILGGLVTTYIALNTVSGGEGAVAGFFQVKELNLMINYLKRHLYLISAHLLL